MEGSPKSFAHGLSRLPLEDLATLLTRRPEAGEIAARGSVTWGALASALSGPRGVHQAIAGLDRLLDQVLQLACAYGGRLTPATAAAEGLEASVLARAARDLARWGLALPERDGVLGVPGCVTSQVRSPAGLGQPAALLLEHVTVDDLRRTADHLGIERPKFTPRKGDLVAWIAARLADRAAVRAILAAAPPKARAALDALRERGASESSWDAYASGQWDARRGSDDGPAWLVARGLALPREQWSLALAVPLEVEHALRGRCFATWSIDPPALSPAPLREDRHPALLVAEMSALLDAWRHEPPGALLNGGVPKRDLKRAAQRLGWTEAWAGDLAGFALAAGLLVEREVVPEKRSRSYRHPRVLHSREAVHEVRAESWDTLDGLGRWLVLVRAWSDRLSDPLADPWPQGPGHWRLLLALLADLPEGQGADASHLGALLAWRHPAAFPDAESAAHFAALAGSTLRALGAGGAEPAIGLSRVGRTVLLNGGAIDVAPLREAFPAPVETCTVTADHRVVVAGPPAGPLAATLTLLADLVSLHPAHVYRLSDATLRRALDAGWTAERILAAMRQHAPAGVPQNVVAFVEDTARRHGRLRVGAAAQYVVVDDAAQLEQVLRSRAGRALGLRRVAPTVAVADAKSVRQVLETLRGAGLMPVPDGTREEHEHPRPAAPAPDRVAPAATPRGLALLETGEPQRLGPADARRLAAQLGAAPRPTGREVTGEATAVPVRKVLARAAREGRAVRIEYRVAGARSGVHALVHPHWVGGDQMEAYDGAHTRRFDVRAVIWAEPVDGAVAERLWR